eukprot:1159521-Pelagomonas_calceolata.AAC.10
MDLGTSLKAKRFCHPGKFEGGLCKRWNLIALSGCRAAGTHTQADEHGVNAGMVKKADMDLCPVCFVRSRPRPMLAG